MSPSCHSSDEFSQTLSVSCCSSASNPNPNPTSVYHSQHTLKNKRWGRPGNEAQIHPTVHFTFPKCKFGSRYHCVGPNSSKNLLLLPASRAQSARPTGLKITLLFPGLYICASAIITCAIITSHTLLPCDLTLVDFGNLDGCFV